MRMEAPLSCSRQERGAAPQLCCGPFRQHAVKTEHDGCCGFLLHRRPHGRGATARAAAPSSSDPASVGSGSGATAEKGVNLQCTILLPSALHRKACGRLAAAPPRASRSL
jgi:hypothetical protein